MGVEVGALIAPVVLTDLHRGLAKTPAQATLLEAFVTAALRGLKPGVMRCPLGWGAILRVDTPAALDRFLGIANRSRQWRRRRHASPSYRQSDLTA